MTVDLPIFLLSSPYFGNTITHLFYRWAECSKEFISRSHCSATEENNGLLMLHIIHWHGQSRFKKHITTKAHR